MATPIKASEAWDPGVVSMLLRLSFRFHACLGSDVLITALFLALPS